MGYLFEFMGFMNFFAKFMGGDFSGPVTGGGGAMKKRLGTTALHDTFDVSIHVGVSIPGYDVSILIRFGSASWFCKHFLWKSPDEQYNDPGGILR